MALDVILPCPGFPWEEMYGIMETSRKGCRE